MKASDLISLIDHTRLEDNDHEDQVAAFCQQAVGPIGSCAAVCIYPEYIETAKKALKNTSVKIATVANFPQGANDFHSCLSEMQDAFDKEVDEIDIVLPYHELLKGNDFFVQEFLKGCRRYSENKIVKIIIESGALTTDLIQKVSQWIIDAELDFIKTSTGKIEKGASSEAVSAILEVIAKNKTPTGLKISGGVRTVEDAEKYIALTEKIMGPNWISPERFRLGSSKLVQALN